MRRSMPLLLLAGVFVFLLDQGLKWLSLHTWSQSTLLSPLLGWQPFLNAGAIFGLPVPPTALLIITGAIIAGLLWRTVVVLRSSGNQTKEMLGYIFIISGALSNFLDRLLLSATVDYLRLLTGVFNLADFVILAGLLLLIKAHHRHNS